MANILTESLRLKNLNNFVSNLTNQSVYVSFSGPTTGWATSPTQPLDSYNVTSDVFSDMLYMKKLQATNFLNVAANYSWISGNIYQQYSASIDISTLTSAQSYITATITSADLSISAGSIVVAKITNPGVGYTTAPTVVFSGGSGTATATTTISGGSVTGLTFTSNSGYTSVPTITFSSPIPSGATGPLSGTNQQPYYVVTPQMNVYKCIGNNGGGISTVQPTSILTAALPAALSDGYIWKYMYTISTLDQEQFYTSNWIPVRYVTTNPGTVLSSGDQWSVQYYAQNTSGATAPFPYHGANAQKELNATSLMMKVRVTGSEGGQIVDTPSYSQIAIVSNPIQNGSTGISPGGATGPNTLQLSAAHATAIGATSPLTSYIGYPTTGKNMVILSGAGAGQVNTISNLVISGASAAVVFSSNWTTVPDSSSTYGVISNTAVINQTTVLTVVAGGVFTVNSTVTGSVSLATGTVVKFDSTTNLVYLTSVTGVFTTADSVNTKAVTAISVPSLLANFADVLYLENRTSIQRYPDQIEDVKIVVEF